ncbi:MAG: ParA family protein [Pyramidobacter sp.]|nr:ParA family protein [Pyramidobacter sp.]
MIITVMSNRGGVGKTTMATIIAELAFSRLLSQGKIDGAENPTPLVCALDFDRQHNLLDNFTKPDTQIGEAKKLYELFRKKHKVTEADFLDYIAVKSMRLAACSQDQLLEITEVYRHVVIDTPPSLESSDIKMLDQISDLIVVPFMSSRNAIRGVKSVLEEINHPKQNCILLYLKEPKTLLQKIIEPFYIRYYVKPIRWDAICSKYIELPLYAQVPKNVYLKKYYSKGLRKSQKAAYAELEKAIFDN